MNKTILLSILAATTIALTDAKAQFLFDQNESKQWGTDYGSPWLGGSLFAKASLRRKQSWYTRLASASFDLNAKVRFLRVDKSAFSAVISGFARSGGPASMSNPNLNSAQAKLRIRMAGKTIADFRYIDDMSLSYKAYTRDLFPKDISYGISLGPINFALKGNVGVGVSRAASLSFPVQDVALASTVGVAGWGYGRARLSLLVVGVDAVAQLAHTTLSASANVSVKSGFDAEVDLTIRAITLKIKVWLDLWIKKWTKTLVNLSYGTYQTTLLSLGS